MKKRNLWITIVLILAANVALKLYAQENIRAMIQHCENMETVNKDVVQTNYPVVKKFNRSTTRIQLTPSPALEQQWEEAFRQDRDKVIHAVEQKKDGKVYIFYRFASSTYSYTKSNDVINIIENLETGQRIGVYTFFVNVVPDDFRFPLIGFVNTAIGSHQGFQAGFINTTLVDFKGFQAGFVNSTFNDNSGFQTGFVNTIINEVSGFQLGFVNSAGFNLQKASQVGFVNFMRKDINGAQIGFVNTLGGTVQGCQMGYVNVTNNDTYGSQIGYTNVTRKNVQGIQIGFINITGKTVKGSQIGFVNYADTVTGVPIGIISIVKKGGYHAFEYSVNEWYPVNLSFKIGVPQFYSIVQGSYNDGFKKRFAFGYGFGSLIPLSKKFYLNPELMNIQPVSKNQLMQIQSFTANIRFNLLPHLQIAAGPSISHVYAEKDSYFYQPDYSFLNHKIDSKNRLVIGARAALSVNF